MEKKHLVGSILCGLLTAFGIVTTIISLIDGSKGLWLLCDCVYLALLVLIVYYAFGGYKKPHGNLLKYIILLYAIINFTSFPSLVQAGSTGRVVLIAIGIGLLCYIAGRLAKIKENLVLMILVTACIVAGLISGVLSRIATIGIATPVITWLDICVAYFLRYKEHKEAGLMDAPKK